VKIFFYNGLRCASSVLKRKQPERDCTAVKHNLTSQTFESLKGLERKSRRVSNFHENIYFLPDLFIYFGKRYTESRQICRN